MPFLFIDIETDNSEGFGLDPFRANVVTIQIMAPTGHKIILKDPKSLDLFRTKLENNIVVGHNLKFEAKFLKYRFGITLKTVYDTMLAEQVISGGQLSGYSKGNSLKDLVLKYCGVNLDKTEQCSFKAGEELSENQIQYALLDVEYLPEIMRQQQAKIKLLGLENIIDIEMKALPAIAWLELSGINVDLDKLGEIKTKVFAQKSEAEAFLIKELAPIRNLNSSKELLEVLKGKGFALENTGPKELAKYPDNPIIQALKSYRQATKMLTSFINTMPEFIHPITKRVHSNFYQYGALSGRLTSKNPNMQQQPSRFSEWRQIFKAAPGNKIVAADYSQIEMRIVGQLAKDPEYIRAYIQGLDLYKETAAKLFKVPIDQVTEQQRNIAKSVNLGLNYGMWSSGLKSKLKEDVGVDVSVKEAEKFIRDFQALYPRVTAYLNRAGTEGLRKLYVKTAAGRLCRFDTPKDEQEGGSIKRESKNLPVQGLCADMLKIGMGNIFQVLEPRGVKFVNTVHDELVFECKEEEAEEVAAIVKHEMEKAGSVFLTSLPCVCEVSVADFWKKE
jgi:DNA polymerase I-like protein with 3'-5' exonuclease and polymerase domains